MISPVAFEDVAQALAAGGSAVHAAEAHGCLCGALCARRNYPPGEWFEELLPEAPAAAAAANLEGPLGALYASTRGVLAEREMEFAPLLPDEETALAERVEALGAWCQGFLYGFGAAGVIRGSSLAADVAEVLGDFAEIARAGAVGSAARETEEEAYAELVEFLRVGVQLVYDELGAARAGQPAAASQH